MIRWAPRTALLCLGAWSLAACSPTVGLPDGGFSILPDRNITPAPGAALVDPPPPVTPYEIVTFRGTAEGRRVFVTANGINPESSTLGSGGAFCIDVRITNPGTYLFDVQAYGQDNQIGAPLPEKIQVTYDPSAPEIGNDLMTCGGVHPRGCTGQIEICDDGRDNDCNGLRDAEDPACNPCQDDNLEDNDNQAAPSIQPGQYPGLNLCPADPDYYGIYVRQGERVSAQVTFAHAEGDLDLDLLSVRTSQDDDRMVLMRSATIMDQESISYTATVTGVHMLAVYGSMSTSNTYDLVVTLSDN